MDKTAEEFFKHTTGVSAKSTYRIGEDECVELMQQYAQQVSREVAIDFASNYLQVEKELIELEFDNWQSNQEESNG